MIFARKKNKNSKKTKTTSYLYTNNGNGFNTEHKTKMKRLLAELRKENKKQVSDFKTELQSKTTVEEMKSTWWIKQYITPATNKKPLTLDELKTAVLKRYETIKAKDLEKKIERLETVFNAGELLSANITVEWVKSRTWGANPTATVRYSYKTPEGLINYGNVESRSVGGCGFDKLSTAIAEALNQINEVLKPMYTAKNRKPNLSSHELLGYGSGYGILPSLQGGVGVSCYPQIFEKLGFKFRSVSSGKTFDVFEIIRSDLYQY